MQQFHTRKKASVGVEVPLYNPDGTASEHWFRIRGVDSDEFRRAETKAKRSAIELSQIEDEQERADVIRATELSVVAELVAGWSFEEPCTHDNVVNFLTEAPQIADMVNRFAAQRAQFFSKK